MKFIGEVKQITVRECTSLAALQLIECDQYKWSDRGSSMACIWHRLNGTCGHPTNLRELKEADDGSKRSNSKRGRDKEHG